MKKEIRNWTTLACVALIAILAAGPAAAQTCSEETAAIYAAMEAVAALDVPVENALLVELASAMTGLATGDTDAVISDLEAFINKVESKVPQQIDAATAAALIALVQGVIADSLCPCTDLWADWTAPFLADLSVVFAFSIPEPTAIIGAFSPSAGGGFGVQDDFFGTGAATGFICGADPIPTVPVLTLIPLDTQEQLDGCYTVMAGYFSDFGCPSEGGDCGGPSLTDPVIPSTPFLGAQ